MFHAAQAGLPYSSQQVQLDSASGETSTTRGYVAQVHQPSRQDPAQAFAEMRKSDRRMRLHIIGQQTDDNFRPVTPGLLSRAAWLSVISTKQTQRQFLEHWQSPRRGHVVHENILATAIAAEKASHTFAESDVDGDVACLFGATCTGSFGAGSGIVVFLRGETGSGAPIVASIHRRVSEEHPLTPDEAYAKIIQPLVEKMESTLARLGGHVLPDKRFFYFAGGNSQTLQSCAALAFAAETHDLNVAASMLGINDEESYVNAMLGIPTPPFPDGAFCVARVTWSSINSSAENQLAFLNDWQANRGAALVDENALTDFIEKGRTRGTFAESEMDVGVACHIGATTTGSLGACSGIIGMLHGVTDNGDQLLASIHQSVSGERPLSPDAAYDEIIRPLEERMAGTFGHRPFVKSFFFAGGNPHTLQSCAALAFAAKQRHLNVPVSMLGINNKNSYVNAVLGMPVPGAPSGGFFAARGDEGPEAS